MDDGSSLLMVRTDRVVTLVDGRINSTAPGVSSDARISQHIARFEHDLTIVSGNLNYLSTVIVTAAVYWGFDSKPRLAANLSS